MTNITITREEYFALNSEPMTQERYAALCARYGIEATDKIAAYNNGDYDYETYGQKPEYRIRQLRCWQRAKEREAAQTPADEAAHRERQLQHIAAYERAIQEREEIDGGY